MAARTRAGVALGGRGDGPASGPHRDVACSPCRRSERGRWRCGYAHEIPAIVLRRDGVATTTSLIVKDPQNPLRRVIQLLPDGSDRVLDTGRAIQLESLALSADRRTVYWLNGNEPRSAPSG